MSDTIDGARAHRAPYIIVYCVEHTQYTNWILNMRQARAEQQLDTLRQNYYLNGTTRHSGHFARPKRSTAIHSRKLRPLAHVTCDGISVACNVSWLHAGRSN